MASMDSPSTSWRKSRRSAKNGGCVEVASGSGTHLCRDSKDPDGPKLAFSVSEWRRFVTSVKDGRHDLA
jgi:hypothetical protein